MVVSALYLLAGCALFGGAQQAQLSILLPEKRSLVHALLAAMWLFLALLALANSLYISHSGASGLLSSDALIRVAVSTQFILWALLVWLIVLLTGTGATLVPIVLSGVWIFFMFISLRLPLEYVIATLPQQSGGTVTGPVNGWWLSIHLIILATFVYSQYACFQYYNAGNRLLARILAGSLIILLETAIYDLMVTLRLIHSPTITVFGFLALLLLISFHVNARRLGYLQQQSLPVANGPVTPASPGETGTTQAQAATAPGRVQAAADTASPAHSHESLMHAVSKAFTAIDLYAGMGLRRLRRGAEDPEKLNALFRKVQAEAGTGCEITERLAGAQRADKPD